MVQKGEKSDQTRGNKTIIITFRKREVNNLRKLVKVKEDHKYKRQQTLRSDTDVDKYNMQTLRGGTEGR